MIKSDIHFSEYKNILAFFNKIMKCFFNLIFLYCRNLHLLI